MRSSDWAWSIRGDGLGDGFGPRPCRRRPARGEDLPQAWAIALGVNQQLQAQQETSIASGFQVKAADSARYFTVRSYNIETFLSQSPKTKPSLAGNNTTSGGSGTNAGLASLPTVFLLGTKQNFLPISLTTASLPIYTGGKLLTGPSTRPGTSSTPRRPRSSEPRST